jgi:hypothetical protein
MQDIPQLTIFFFSLKIDYKFLQLVIFGFGQLTKQQQCPLFNKDGGSSTWPLSLIISKWFFFFWTRLCSLRFSYSTATTKARTLFLFFFLFLFLFF